MFSEMTLMRPAWARSPDVAIPIERPKSLVSLAMNVCLHCYPLLGPFSRCSALADRGLQKMQALAVERGGRRVIHLVGGNLHHLLFEADRVAGGPGLEAHLLILIEAVAARGRRDMRRAGAPHGERPHCARYRAGRIE